MNDKFGFLGIAGIIAVVLIFVIAMFMPGNGVTGAGVADAKGIPDAQCYNIASNLNKASLDKNWEYTATHVHLNPCTNTKIEYTTYWDFDSFFHRSVYVNGDVVGQAGNTDFILCTDGRAEISNFVRSYYAKGIAWGLRWNRPTMADYVELRCSTL